MREGADGNLGGGDEGIVREYDAAVAVSVSQGGASDSMAASFAALRKSCFV